MKKYVDILVCTSVRRPVNKQIRPVNKQIEDQLDLIVPKPDRESKINNAI
jgi:hypothetical protein